MRSAASIQAEIDAWEAALLAIAQSGGISKYNRNSGQGGQSVERLTPAQISARIRDLEGQLADAQDEGRPPTSVGMDR